MTVSRKKLGLPPKRRKKAGSRLTRDRRREREKQKGHTRQLKDSKDVLEMSLPEYTEPLFEHHRYKVIYGGRGGARSWSVARMLLLRAATEPTRVLCTRELQTSIKDSVHLLLKDQIALLKLDGFTVTHSEIRHANGSVFLFEGLRHNITKIKSLEGIDVCWVEEAERISKESWNVLIPTIRKPGSEIWVTFNPDQEEDSTYARYVTNTPPDTVLLKVSWEDNPFITKELLDEKDYAYATDPDSADHVWGGNTRQITDAVILKGKYVIQEFVPFLGHTEEHPCAELLEHDRCPHAWSGPYQGLDFGFAQDPLAGVRCWIHERKLYVEHEAYGLHVELDHITGKVTTIIPGFQHYVTRADSARPDSISYLKRHGLHRIEPVKKHAGSVEDGIAHLRSYEQIVIHPRCKHTANEAKHYKYKTDERSGDILPIIIDKNNHCIDGIRYALEPMIKPRGKAGFIFPTARSGPRGTVLVSSNGNGNGNGNGHLVGSGLNGRSR